MLLRRTLAAHLLRKPRKPQNVKNKISKNYRYTNVKINGILLHWQSSDFYIFAIAVHAYWYAYSFLHFRIVYVNKLWLISHWFVADGFESDFFKEGEKIVVLICLYSKNRLQILIWRKPLLLISVFSMQLICCEDLKKLKSQSK